MFQTIRNLRRRIVEGPDGFSIICAFNDQAKLERYLIQSLQNQSVPFELLTIDNRNREYACAPRALNEIARKAKYRYLMFVHQDVALASTSWLADVHAMLRHLVLFGAAGVAGRNSEGIAASVSHGVPPARVCSQRLEMPTSVQTLDGCLMIVPKPVFLNSGFDEETCEGWYLYVADYCLDLARRGLKAYVLPCEVYHESTGPSDSRVYEPTRLNLVKKHRDHVETIYTTVGVWDTRQP